MSGSRTHRSAILPFILWRNAAELFKIDLPAMEEAPRAANINNQNGTPEK